MSAFRFDRALLRAPGASVVKGLRSGEGGDPDYPALQAEHRNYAAALEAAGAAVEVLPPREAFPDSVFIEDPALVFGRTAILLRPGAPSRAGEAEDLRSDLEGRFERVLESPEGHADGGDVLVTPQEVFIGLSSRTDAVGAAALERLLADLGLRARTCRPPEGVLHLKTACSLLDEETLLATPAIAASGLFDGWRIVVTPEGEEAAANALRVNDHLLVGAAFAGTCELLARAGYEVRPLAVSEIGKIDAGLSCMSLRWRSA